MKDDYTISAHEVNKFTYCPHQWYYERVYGAKALRKAYRERNEWLGLEDAAGANLSRGLAYHARFSARKRWGWALALIGIAALAVWLLYTRGLL